MKGALVTGAGMRVGRALALALAADGLFLFVHYNRSAGPARETVAARRVNSAFFISVSSIDLRLLT